MHTTTMLEATKSSKSNGKLKNTLTLRLTLGKVSTVRKSVPASATSCQYVDLRLGGGISSNWGQNCQSLNDAKS
jgi:hypothetical protein